MKTLKQTLNEAYNTKSVSENSSQIQDEIWHLWDLYFEEREGMEMGHGRKTLTFDIFLNKKHDEDLKGFIGEVEKYLKSKKYKFEANFDQIIVYL